MPSQGRQAERKCFIMSKRNGCKGTTNRPAVMLHDGAVHQAGKAQSVDVWQEAELLAVVEHLACEIVGIRHLHRFDVVLQRREWQTSLG